MKMLGSLFIPGTVLGLSVCVYLCDVHTYVNVPTLGNQDGEPSKEQREFVIFSTPWNKFNKYLFLKDLKKLTVKRQ